MQREIYILRPAPRSEGEGEEGSLFNMIIASSPKGEGAQGGSRGNREILEQEWIVQVLFD